MKGERYLFRYGKWKKKTWEEYASLVYTEIITALKSLCNVLHMYFTLYRYLHNQIAK